MKLDISRRGYVKLEVDGTKLKAYKFNGEIHDYSLEDEIILDCSHNRLVTLPELPETIITLMCGNNELQSLPVLPKFLVVLFCDRNHLETLPNLPPTLEQLWCCNNHLQTLPLLPTKLRILDCRSNQLRTLQFLPETLTSLWCGGLRYKNQSNPLVFIAPLLKRPKNYQVPDHLKLLHSNENYSNYHRRYQTYFYLITFLTIEIKILPSILSNEAWWFPGQL